ncbi:MAG: nuclear transport factor 2 family protein [Burkholderiales bacterium]|nr:nuclear transport factor 2 family protein [Burkholderiales bacterium]
MTRTAHIITSRLPALFVLSGLVSVAAQAAPVPAPEIAEAQLRAINHRFVSATVDVSGDLMEMLTHEDFVLTESDGSWRDRAEFVARMRRQAPLPNAASVGMQVRLFGPVALVHGVFLAASPGGDAARPARVRYTDVYVWNATAWQLVSVQNTPLADDPVGVPMRQGSAPLDAPFAPHAPYAPWAGRDPAGDDIDVLLALNENYVAAFRQADVAWYGAHLAPDYVMVAGDGSLLDRAATLTRFAQPTFATAMRSFPVGRVSVRRFQDVALIHAENDYVLKDGRRGISRYTDIWHKREGRWLCIAAHITVHRAPSM